MASDCLAWLDANNPSRHNADRHQPKSADDSRPVPPRRKSVAGSSLYSVHGEVKETGSDYLPKISRGSEIAGNENSRSTTKKVAIIAANCNGSDKMNKIRCNNDDENHFIDSIAGNSTVTAKTPNKPVPGLVSIRSNAPVADAGICGAMNKEFAAKKPVPGLFRIIHNTRNIHVFTSLNKAAAMGPCNDFDKNSNMPAKTPNKSVPGLVCIRSSAHVDADAQNKDVSVGSSKKSGTSRCNGFNGNLNTGETSIRNNFDPFRRSTNVPFSLFGRPRVKSVD